MCEKVVLPPIILFIFKFLLKQRPYENEVFQAKINYGFNEKMICVQVVHSHFKEYLKIK